MKKLDKIIEIPKKYYDWKDNNNACYLCKNPNYHTLYKIEEYGFPIVFKQCECGLIKQIPMPNNKFFSWFFNSEIFFKIKKNKKIWGYHNYFSNELCRLKTDLWRIKKFRHLFSTKKLNKIMQIGPGTGSLLYQANKYDFLNAYGCDVSARFVDYAKNHYRVKIDNGRFEYMNYDDGEFDAIFLFNVIENIPNQVEFFKAVRRTLKPGGYFILNFVDMEKNILANLQKEKYFLFRPPVCYIYSLPVIKKVLNKFGFDIIELQRDMRYMNIEKIITLLGLKWPLYFLQFFKVDKIPFKIYAYPSKILVCRKLT